MALPNELHPLQLGAGSASAYQIEQSLRFDGSSYLSRTFSSAGNRKTFTVSWWVKRATGNSLTYRDDYMFSAYDGGGSGFQLKFTGTESADGVTEFSNDQGYSGSPSGYSYTNNKYRDESSWYHIVYVADYSNATAADRRRIYFNGERVTSFRIEGTYSDADSSWNYAGAHYIGRYVTTTNYNFHGYMAEVNVIDGQGLLPTDFGEYDDNGVWRPIRYTGTYGTNGFYLTFDPSATNGIGHDHSGNGNNFTPSGFDTTNSTASTYDVMSDTPTTNYCTWNPIGRGPGVYAPRELHNGNLEILYKRTGIGDWFATTTWCFPQSGNFYWEVTVLATSSDFMLLGIAEQDWTWNTSPTVRYISSDGKISNHVSNAQANPNYTGATYGLNDVIGMAWNGSNNTLQFYKNGVAQGSPLSPTATEGRTFCPIFHAANDNWRVALNAGQRAFAYTPPTGYVALNTSNLPAPDIADGSDYFNTVLYTGNGTTDHAITGVGFQPDFVWGKRRDGAYSHGLFDSIRGGDKRLVSNLTNAEDTLSEYIKSFDTDGFTLGNDANLNLNTASMVAWNWLGANGTSSNTDGSITSTVSANPTAGFSIVSYTGTQAAATVGHGLGVAPSLIITRNRDSNSVNWRVQHASLGPTKYLSLNLTDAAGTASSVWNNTAPTSTVFSVADDGGSNGPSNGMVAYCFAEVEGYSKIGSFIGNGSSAGPFVYCGFRPAWLLMKNTGSSHWLMLDVARGQYYNPIGYKNATKESLYANSSAAESGTGTGFEVDFLSSGFKCRASVPGELNQSGSTYVFAAFAENPFGGDGVSPATAR